MCVGGWILNQHVVRYSINTWFNQYSSRLARGSFAGQPYGLSGRTWERLERCAPNQYCSVLYASESSSSGTGHTVPFTAPSWSSDYITALAHGPANFPGVRLRSIVMSLWARSLMTSCFSGLGLLECSSTSSYPLMEPFFYTQDCHKLIK
jgi:hypothetical protein